MGSIPVLSTHILNVFHLQVTTIHLLCISSIQQSSPTDRLLATEPFSSAHFKQSLRTMYQPLPSHLVLLVIYSPISQSIFIPFACHLLRLTHHSAVATRNAPFSTARRFETHVHHRASARDLVILMTGAFSKKKHLGWGGSGNLPNLLPSVTPR